MRSSVLSHVCFLSRPKTKLFDEQTTLRLDSLAAFSLSEYFCYDAVCGGGSSVIDFYLNNLNFFKF